MAILTEPAERAAPIIANVAEMKRALLRPTQSARNPWMKAPRAAPAAKRALTAPRILWYTYSAAGSKFVSIECLLGSVCAGRYGTLVNVVTLPTRRDVLTIEIEVGVEPGLTNARYKDGKPETVTETTESNDHTDQTIVVANFRHPCWNMVDVQ